VQELAQESGLALAQVQVQGSVLVQESGLVLAQVQV
jgi:hypothetical protein